jgi:hypothetical protein
MENSLEFAGKVALITGETVALALRLQDVQLSSRNYHRGIRLGAVHAQKTVTRGDSGL